MFFSEMSDRNHGAPVPPSERQSVSRGGLRGVLHALQSQRPQERMVIVLDSEYVFKGIMEWSAKWRRHSWRTASGEVGHRDLWEAILELQDRGGGGGGSGESGVDPVPCQGDFQPSVMSLPLAWLSLTSG